MRRAHVGVLLSSCDQLMTLESFQTLSRPQQSDLLLHIGELHLHGSSADVPLATHFLEQSARQFGNAKAQFLLGAMISTNMTHPDPALAILHYHMAARGGSIEAAMALGYRALYGIGTPKNCHAALQHYKFAADSVMTAQTSTKQPIQLFSSHEPFRLSDDATHWASHSSDLDHERIEYLRMRAKQSGNEDPTLLVNAASVLLFSDLVSPNDAMQHRHQEARAFLERAVNLGSSSAQALLGHVYAYGLGGVDADSFKAIELYEEALASNASESAGEAANGLGRVYFHGVGGIPVDYERAMSLFEFAAHSGHADGVYHTAMLLSNANPARAHDFLAASAEAGHLKSLYRLAKLKESQQMTACTNVVLLYKQVAEHHNDARETLDLVAHQAMSSSGFGFQPQQQHALRLYLMAAELGFEVAQSNAAWLMERDPSIDHQINDAYLSLVLRGVAQHSVDALIRYGDLLFAQQAYDQALAQYAKANALSGGGHARALFNLGYMHEHGYAGSSSVDWQIAQLYYELVAMHEPRMAWSMTLLRWKLAIYQALAPWLAMLTTPEPSQ